MLYLYLTCALVSVVGSLLNAAAGNLPMAIYWGLSFAVAMLLAPRGTRAPESEDEC